MSDPEPLTIPFFQVDAFASRPFEGNPAAVCPLPRWMDDALLGAVAMENNLSETAFFVEGADDFHIRWFTPKVEVDLCGHATLAAAHVLFHHLGRAGDTVAFTSRSGPLRVLRRDGLLVLDFPADAPRPVPAPEGLLEALGVGAAEAVLQGREDVLVVLPAEREVRELRPDFSRLSRVPARGVIVSAPASSAGADFVSRFFAPAVGVDEDPVTGSAHTTLAPYWASRLGRSRLHARQVSARGGSLVCEDRGERVHIGGTAVTTIVGTFHLPAGSAEGRR